MTCVRGGRRFFGIGGLSRICDRSCCWLCLCWRRGEVIDRYLLRRRKMLLLGWNSLVVDHGVGVVGWSGLLCLRLGMTWLYLRWWCFRDYCRGCVGLLVPWSLLHVVGGVAWWCSVFGRCACVILGQTPNFLLEDWIRKKNFNCRGGRTEELIVQYYLARLRRRTWWHCFVKSRIQATLVIN